MRAAVRCILKVTDKCQGSRYRPRAVCLRGRLVSRYLNERMIKSQRNVLVVDPMGDDRLLYADRL
jgi:hypothetical protein